MKNSDQHESDDRSRLSPEEAAGDTEDERTPADMVMMCILWALTGAAFGWVIAWGLDASTTWQIGVVCAGAVVTVVIGMLWVASPLGAWWLRGFRQWSRVFRWATEDPESPVNLGEAVEETVKREQSRLGYEMFTGAIGGGLLGGMLGLLAGGIWWAIGLVLGTIAGAAFGWALVVGSTAFDIAIVRMLGLPFGSACIGGLVGAGFGVLLWHRWRKVGQPNQLALIIGIAPIVLFAVLFGVLGWQRSKRNEWR